MFRYLLILHHLLIFQVKHLMVYRLNGLLRMVNYPCFTLGSFIALYVAYQASPTIAGWSYAQALVLFLTYHLAASLAYGLFFEGGVRRFLYWGVRSGEFDFVLTKPINSQFLAMFGRPCLDGLSNMLILTILTTYLHWHHQLPSISFETLPIYSIFLIIGLISYYLFCSGIATLAFYVSSGGELVEIISKLEESGQRPISIYPQYLRFLALTIFPFGLIGYVPATILLNKISWPALILAGLSLPITYLFNRLMWRRGLRHYSSASS